MADKRARAFFLRMRRNVTKSVRRYGLKNISGWKVTEKGIKVKLNYG